MKRNKIKLLIVGTILPICAFGQNPVIQHIYTADPAPMVHNDTLYLYTGHDEDSSTWFTMKDWRCFSTTDMVNWTDRGSPLSQGNFTWAKSDAWAGQCIFRNGKFFWYVPVNQSNGKGMAIGVAVGLKATGPFSDPLGKPLVYSGPGDIDPTVFIDNDGQAYLYWGNPYLKYVKLNDDMTSYSGEIVTVPLTAEAFGIRTGDTKRFSQYEEGPWFYKRENRYYLIYPAGGVPEHLAYSTSQYPTGPWVYQDTIMAIIGEGGAFTNHPAIVDFKGNSYFFYHNGALPGGGGFDRSVCVEEFRCNEDGTIPRIQNTKAGIVKGLGSHNPYTKTEAETMAWGSGIETTVYDDAGIAVTDIDSGDFIKVRNVDFGNGAISFEASVNACGDGGKIEIRTDSLSGAIMGICEVENAINNQKWNITLCDVKNPVGVHDLYFVFTGKEDNLFNFDWWRFSETSRD